MIYDRILHLDTGGEPALAYAKKRAHGLIAQGTEGFSHEWPIEGFTVLVRCMKERGDYIVKYFVTGGATYLYTWPTDEDAQVTVPVGNFRIVKRNKDNKLVEKLADEERITAVNLVALGEGFKFSTRMKIHGSVSFSAMPLLTKSRICGLLERSVRNEDWFAHNLLSWFLPRHQFVWKGAPLTVVKEDCLISKWFFTGEKDQNGKEIWDFNMMLGAFESKSTPAFARLADQKFTGVVVPFRAIKKAIEPITSTVFKVNLDSDKKVGDFESSPTVARLVTQVNGYERKDPFGGGIVTGDPAVSFEENFIVPSTSPFARVYQYTLADQSLGSFVTFTAHTLSTAGAIQQNDMLDDVLTGTATRTGFDITGFTCDLTFFTGEKFRRYGSHVLDGASGLGSPVTWDRTSSLPLPANVVGEKTVADTFQGFIGEYGLMLSGNTDGTVTVTPLGGIEHFSTGGGYATDSTTATGSDFPQVKPIIETQLDGSGNAVETAFGDGTEFGFNGGFLGMPACQGLVLPNNTPAYGMGGIFWHRDGPPGVFIFQAPTDVDERAARAEDCDLYQKVITATPGYRKIKQDDGTFIIEDGYEDPVAVLARVVARTTVIANNFAPPALFPWIEARYVGVILDATDPPPPPSNNP